MNAKILGGIAAAALAWAGLSIVACSSDDDGLAPGGPDASTSDVSAPNDAASSDAGDAATSVDAADAAPALDCPDAGGVAATLACTGLYADIGAKTIAPGVAPYAPAASLWYDGATVQRWIALPAGAKIDDSDPDEWKFPVGTRVWQELSVGGKRVETRLFQKLLANYWEHATYAWKADESDATSSNGGDLATVMTSDAGTTWHVPTPTECDECHRGRTYRVLGFEAVGLGLPGAQGLTLAALAGQGLLAPAPTKTSFTIADDGSGKAAPALAWLHANCGVSCHSQNTSSMANGTGEHFRIEVAWLASGQSATTYDSETTTVDVPAQIFDTGQMRIAPGDPDHSVVMELAGARNADYSNQMPPVASKVVPADAIRDVRAWIAALPQPTVDAGADGGSTGDAGDEDGGADAAGE